MFEYIISRFERAMDSAIRSDEWKKRFELLVHNSSDSVEQVSLEQTIESGLSSKLRRLATKRENTDASKLKTPMQRMQECRDALGILDRRGWNRSFHQRLFHEDFLVSHLRSKKQKLFFVFMVLRQVGISKKNVVGSSRNNSLKRV